MTLHSCFLLLFALLVSSASARCEDNQALPSPLTLEGAVKYALAHQPILRAEGAQDEAAETPWRELLLEHVQIREVSGMMRRLLEEKRDPAAARALCGNLASRWEAHTAREEREVFPLFGQEVDDQRA